MKISLLLISIFIICGFFVYPFSARGLETTKNNSVENFDQLESRELSRFSKIETLRSGELTIEKFNQIEFGMSYEEVVNILGEEGVETRSSINGINVSKTYVWKGKISERISATFINYELGYINQSGLTGKNGDSEVTAVKFEQIKIGMSYEDVTGLIGSDGEKTSMAKIGDSVIFTYVWRGKNFKSIRVSLRNDKLTNKLQTSLFEDVYSEGLSIEKFNKFKFGMSYGEVVEILGSEGVVTRLSVIGPEESKTYVWKSEKFQRILTTFRNGQLRHISQSGLTGNIGKDEITKAKFDQIKKGMSYKEVGAIIGSDGEKTAMSQIGGSTLVSYVWKAAKFQTLRVSFRDDKMTNKTQTELK